MSIEEEKGARRSLLGAGALVSVLTLASRILGLLRDALIAALFGATGATDAFFVAFRIPNLFRRLVAEGAFSQGFVPVLAATRREGGEGAARDLLDHISGVLLLALLVLVGLGMVCAPWLIALFAPGFDGEGARFALAVEMLRICFPYLLCMSLVALSAGIHNSYGRFGLPAATPVLLNLCFIGAMVLYWDAQPTVLLLAWTVLVAGFVQLAAQGPGLWSLRRLPRPRLRRGHAGVQRVLRLMGPAVFGASVTQFNLLVDTLLASFLVTGSISWLYYADRLMELPIGLVAVALGTVVLPTLSSRHAGAEEESFGAALDWGVRTALLLALPAALALFLLAGPLITTLFQYGEMTADDVRYAAWALQAYAVGVPGLVAVKVLAPGYFAREDTVTPVRIAVVAVGANILLNLLLIQSLAHVGLALATALAGLLNAGLLATGLIRSRVYRADRAWRRFLPGMVAGLTALGLLLGLGTPELSWWLGAGLLERVGVTALLCVSGLGAFLLAAFLGGIRPADLRGPALVP